MKEKLFGGSEEHSDVSPEAYVEKIPIDEVYIHPANVRLHRDQGDIERMADSITKRGLEYPLRVVEESTEDGRYGCYDGGFRLLACEELGRKKVPAIVGSGGHAELSLRSFDAEDKSIQLNPIEEAKFFKEMKEELGTYKDVREAVDRSHNYIKSRVNLLDLSEEVQDLVLKGYLGISAANFLLEQPDDVRVELVKSIRGETELADLRKLAAELKGQKPQPIISIGMDRVDREMLVGAAESEGKSVSEYCYKLLRRAPGSPLSDDRD